MFFEKKKFCQEYGSLCGITPYHGTILFPGSVNNAYDNLSFLKRKKNSQRILRNHFWGREGLCRKNLSYGGDALRKNSRARNYCRFLGGIHSLRL